MIEDGSASERALPASLAIELDQVRFGYGDGPDILRDFSLTIEPGTMVGIVGRSGVGKTTLQHLLSRLFDVRAGTVRIGGFDIRTLPLTQPRGSITSVAQSGAMFFAGMTVNDVIRFGRPEASFDEVAGAAHCSCIHDEIMALPLQYDTPVAEGGSNFSKGQQQRMGLAQALLALGGDRKILILDEFTSALDARTEHRALENLRPRLRGKTVVMIAHRLATVRKLADKVVLIDRNGIVEQGAHADLVPRGASYAELVRLQNTA